MRKVRKRKPSNRLKMEKIRNIDQPGVENKSMYIKTVSFSYFTIYLYDLILCFFN